MKKILLGLFAFSLVFGAVSFTSHKAQAENIFTRFLSFGSRGADVVALQQVLKNEGLLGAAATGYYGVATTDAVKKLQAQNDLEVVGKVGPKTLSLVTTKATTLTTTVKTETVTPTKTTTTLATASIGCTATSPASITVVTPNGGETFIAGQQAKVRWTTCNVPTTSNINIMITMNSTSIASTAGVTPNDGIEAIDLPTQANLPAGTAMIYGNVYKVNLFVSGMNVSDSSDNLFTINGGTMAGCTPTSTQAIQVTSPNGGETYTAGQQMTITWKTCNVPVSPYINQILLEKQVVNSQGALAHTAVLLIAQNTANTGSYSWTIPTSMQNGSNYIISMQGSLTGVEGTGFIDSSDNAFTINNTQAQSQVLLHVFYVADGLALPSPTFAFLSNSGLSINPILNAVLGLSIGHHGLSSSQQGEVSSIKFKLISSLTPLSPSINYYLINSVGAQISQPQTLNSNNELLFSNVGDTHSGTYDRRLFLTADQSLISTKAKFIITDLDANIYGGNQNNITYTPIPCSGIILPEGNTSC